MLASAYRMGSGTAAAIHQLIWMIFGVAGEPGSPGPLGKPGFACASNITINVGLIPPTNFISR
jgi:hypothetical protein